LPREVFFGRLGFAGAFFTVWASDFERFLPATSDSFPIDVLPDAPYRGSRRPVPWVGFRLARVYAVAVDADLLETVGAQARSNSADRAACRCGASWSSVWAMDVAEWRKCDSSSRPSAE